MRDEIVILSDTHLGIKSSWKRDKSGISLKTLDNIRRFHWILDEIDETKTALVIIGGDFFDHYHVSMSVMVKIISVIRRMASKKIGIIIIGGNHDNTSNIHLKERLDILNSLPNCLVFRSFATINFKTEMINGYFGDTSVPQFNSFWKRYIVPDLSSLEVGLGLFSFMSMRGLKDLYYRTWMEEETGHEFHQSVPREKLEFFISRTIIQQKMIDHLNNCTNKIAIGHYQLVGSRIHEGQQPMITPRELHFSKEMIRPDLWNFVGFGHIHLPQPVWGHDTDEELYKVQHIGASDKFNFGERDDPRRYIVYNCNTKKAHSISLDPNLEENRPQVRFMLQEEVDVPLGDPEPNETIINHIITSYSEEKLLSSNFKIVINIHAEDTARYDKKVIRERLNDIVFYLDIINTNIIRTERREDFKNVKERTPINIQDVLDDFLDGLKVEMKGNEDIMDLMPRINIISHDILEEAERDEK